MRPVTAFPSPTLRAGRERGRAAMAAVVAVLVVPLLADGLQAVADQWTGTAAWPQRLGWRGVRAVVGDPLVSRAIVNSTLVAALALAVALPPTWLAARPLHETTGRSRTVLVAVLLVPLIVPQLAVGAGLTTWFLRLGLADTVPSGGRPTLPLVTIPFVRADPQVGAALTLVRLAPALLLAGATLVLSTVARTRGPTRTPEVP